MVNVNFFAFDVRISRNIDIPHLPSVGDEVFAGLQRGIVFRRWWNVEQYGPSILVRLTELNGSELKDSTENWSMLLHVFNRDKWNWSGNFTEHLMQAWKSF